MTLGKGRPSEKEEQSGLAGVCMVMNLEKEGTVPVDAPLMGLGMCILFWPQLVSKLCPDRVLFIMKQNCKILL